MDRRGGGGGVFGVGLGGHSVMEVGVCVPHQMLIVRTQWKGGRVQAVLRSSHPPSPRLFASNPTAAISEGEKHKLNFLAWRPKLVLLTRVKTMAVRSAEMIWECCTSVHRFLLSWFWFLKGNLRCVSLVRGKLEAFHNKSLSDICDVWWVLSYPVEHKSCFIVPGA